MNSSTPLSAKAASAVTALLAILPSHASACAVCMGADDNVGEAVNGAIFLMLGFIGTMLAALVGFAFYLMKRANSPLSSEVGVAHIASDPEEQS